MRTVPMRALRGRLRAKGTEADAIGGAAHCEEIDLLRAIDPATRLTLSF